MPPSTLLVEGAHSIWEAYFLLSGDQERGSVLLALAVSQVSLVQDNQYAKMAYFGGRIFRSPSEDQVNSQIFTLTLNMAYISILRSTVPSPSLPPNFPPKIIYTKGRLLRYLWKYSWAGAHRCPE